MKFIDKIIDPVQISTTGCRDVGYTYLISWGWEISMTHCMWNTGDGNMDFRKNLPLKENTKQETYSETAEDADDDPVCFFKLSLRNSVLMSP